MKTAKILLLTWLCMAHSTGGTGAEVTGSLECTDAYKRLPASTFCDAQAASDITERGVTEDDAKVIVDTHNNFRASVDPTASDMQKMYWDPQLSALAQAWTDHCETGHDTNVARNVHDFKSSIGQNAAWGQQSWQIVVEDWHSEVENFVYGQTRDETGHYTQVVAAHAAAVGCGYTKCSFGKFYACNYIFGQAGYDYPYSQGTSCSACSSGNCQNNMCDCGGKFCKNGGTMDLTTCSCECPSGASGDTCQNFDCPVGDDCTDSLSYDNYQDYCIAKVETSGVSWMTRCRVTCGYCPNECSGIYCQNGATLKSGCACECPSGFSGTLCEVNELCSQEETWPCGGTGGYTVEQCIYSNVPVECPQMCGVC